MKPAAEPPATPDPRTTEWGQRITRELMRAWCPEAVLVQDFRRNFRRQLDHLFRLQETT